MNIDLKRLNDQFALLTVGENKVPNFSWAKQQKEKLSFDEFAKRYNYKGGIFKKDGSEIPETKAVGIVTGFEDLEVIDVDLKVFSTAQEKTDFWNEYTGYLRDNIYDFDIKFVIYRTKNDGYHILYKSKRVQGNLKLAKLKGHKEAIVETRGSGGYVFLYPDNKVSKKSYFDIDYISDEDREILFSFSRMYDFVEETTIPQVKIHNKDFEKGGQTPWEDYNNKTDIFKLIADDFEVKHNMSTAKKYVVKRYGADSAHSGYIFKDSMCMYLFSTGTIYPHETLLTPFHIYTYKNHNGDFKEASRDIYKQGFGDRLKVKVPESIKEDIKIENIEFPLHIYPKDLQLYILKSHDVLKLNVEIMASTMLWLTSVLMGNSYKVQIKEGWHDSAIIFLALVGQSGLGKTPAVNQISFPLKKINEKRIMEYFDEYERYEEHLEMMKKSKNKNVMPIKKPSRKQILAADTTIEALINLHNESKNAIGIDKDELDGWFKDMNKYREGSDKQQWLSIWSNNSIIVNRLSRSDLYIASPFISVIGGIQPEILDAHFTQENISSGFIDRFLFCYPEDLRAIALDDKEMSKDLIEHYSNTIQGMHKFISDNIKYFDNGNIKPYLVLSSPEANERLLEINNLYVKIQNSDTEPEMFKSMLAKIKTYIPRLTLIIHFLDKFYKNEKVTDPISLETVNKTFDLTEYFIAQFKRIKIDSMNSRDIYNIKKGKKNENTVDSFMAIYKQLDEDKINKSQLARQFNVSRATINNWIKNIQNESK